MGCSESQSHGSRALVQQPATLPSPSEGTSSKLGSPMNLSVPLFLLSTKLLMSFYYYFLMETGPLSFNSLEYQERVWSFFFFNGLFPFNLVLIPMSSPAFLLQKAFPGKCPEHGPHALLRGCRHLFLRRAPQPFSLCAAAVPPQERGALR